MITILKKKTNGVREQLTIEENPTSGTWGDLQLLKNEYRKQDIGWQDSDRFKQLLFNTAFLEKMLKEYQELHCEFCGKPNLRIYHWTEKQGSDVATVDHWIPVKDAPHLAKDERNCKVACRKCNHKKGSNIWPEETLKFPYLKTEC